MARILPARTSTTADDVYRSSLSAVERSFRATQRRLSSAANSLALSVRRFADERPLHFVGVVAAVALITGVGLRIWRSNEDA
jgi:ElaB/YqjD/DUF883 family membrane-anchored ribosome-binding protein